MIFHESPHFNRTRHSLPRRVPVHFLTTNCDYSVNFILFSKITKVKYPKKHKVGSPRTGVPISSVSEPIQTRDTVRRGLCPSTGLSLRPSPPPFPRHGSQCSLRQKTSLKRKTDSVFTFSLLKSSFMASTFPFHTYITLFTGPRCKTEPPCDGKNTDSVPFQHWV